MKRLICLVLALPILVPITSTFSQDSSQVPTIRATVEMVNILCTVRDRKGGYVADLGKDDFEVLEEGVSQKVEYFNHETGGDAQPLTIVLAIDTSGSIKEQLYFEQEAAAEFFQKVLRKDKDMAAVIQFDSEINLVQDFTFDPVILKESIGQMRAGGATKLYDAIWVAVSDLLRHQVGRKVLVVISDGADTQSMLEDDEAIRVAQGEDVVIFGIGVRSGGFGSDFGKLKEFAHETGGLFFNSKLDMRELRDAFDKIDREIKNQYNIAYTSSNPSRDGKFREIEVRVRRPGLKVNHRKGYYAADSSS